MLSRNHSGIQFITGIGVGITAGCLLGVLYAPQAGKRTRRQIASAVEDSVDYVTSKAEDTAGFVRRKSARLQRDARGLLNRTQEVIEKGGDRLTQLRRASAR